jgi:hypothetical protein
VGTATTKKKGRSSPARNRSSETLEVTKPTRSRAKRGPVRRQYVAVDLHAARPMIVRENHAGEEVGVVRIDNSAMELARALADAGPNPEVAIGWRWPASSSPSSTRPARRRDPLPRSDPGEGVRPDRHSQGASSRIGMTPPSGARSRM